MWTTENICFKFAESSVNVAVSSCGVFAMFGRVGKCTGDLLNSDLGVRNRNSHYSPTISPAFRKSNCVK